MEKSLRTRRGIIILTESVINFTYGLKGTYLLFIKIIESVEIRIRGKTFFLNGGYYIYIGSAFGAGGLSSRLHRHLRKIKKKHWHIDQITTSKFSEIIGIGVLLKQRVECVLSKIIEDIEKTVPITGFGNSDCEKKCTSHLFRVS
ncbi:MAG: GIY-YIG nuclease family protein [Candidatus Heimdallarchaeota archaeon]|nr:GIY-YIG nuclease family protein [Candidatus Heimdallarchaeota archaeon]MCK4972068.1 GIY-YIG nuclease family protein [Candidatus Heimdallarchaeota archaeon]